MLSTAPRTHRVTSVRPLHGDLPRTDATATATAPTRTNTPEATPC
ncbi:hypothetical protein [Streptomyces sp. AC627_RSS907]|nr:hypothetical protein [Streptomyces sp. AC627_RSS907]